jgi:hypothetical protein
MVWKCDMAPDGNGTCNGKSLFNQYDGKIINQYDGKSSMRVKKQSVRVGKQDGTRGKEGTLALGRQLVKGKEGGKGSRVYALTYRTPTPLPAFKVVALPKTLIFNKKRELCIGQYLATESSSELT